MNTINKIISIVIALIATINIYAQKNIMDIHVYPQVSAGKTKQCIVTLVNQTNDSIVILNGTDYTHFQSQMQVSYYDDNGKCVSVDNARTGRGYIFSDSPEKYPAIYFLKPKSSKSFAFQYGERVDGVAQKLNVKKIEIDLWIRYGLLYTDPIHYYYKKFTFDYWNAK